MVIRSFVKGVVKVLEVWVELIVIKFLKRLSFYGFRFVRGRC